MRIKSLSVRWGNIVHTNTTRVMIFLTVFFRQRWRNNGFKILSRGRWSTWTSNALPMYMNVSEISLVTPLIILLVSRIIRENQLGARLFRYIPKRRGAVFPLRANNKKQLCKECILWAYQIKKSFRLESELSATGKTFMPQWIWKHYNWQWRP